MHLPSLKPEPLALVVSTLQLSQLNPPPVDKRKYGTSVELHVRVRCSGVSFNHDLLFYSDTIEPLPYCTLLTVIDPHLVCQVPATTTGPASFQVLQ